MGRGRSESLQNSGGGTRAWRGKRGGEEPEYKIFMLKRETVKGREWYKAEREDKWRIPENKLFIFFFNTVGFS